MSTGSYRMARVMEKQKAFQARHKLKSDPPDIGCRYRRLVASCDETVRRMGVSGEREEFAVAFMS